MPQGHVLLIMGNSYLGTVTTPDTYSYIVNTWLRLQSSVKTLSTLQPENEQRSCYNEGNFFSLSPLLRCDKSVMGAHTE